MINYAALLSAKKNKSPIFELLVIFVLFIIIFGGAVVIFSADKIMLYVAVYGGYALGVLAVALVAIYTGVFYIAHKKMLQQRQMLSNFAEHNNWVFELVTDKASLPIGLPESTYIQSKKINGKFATPPAMVVSGSTGLGKFKLIYVRDDGLLFPWALSGLMTRRWPLYYTYVGHQTASGMWSFTQHKGFVFDKMTMKSILEQ